MKYLLIFVAFLLLFSCSKDKEELPTGIKEGIGEVWLSGGLYFCAEQIRLNKGDTLIIVNKEAILSFKSGDRVDVKYRETGQNETGCTIGKDCEIIEIEKTN